jgi:hypothetical protein
MDRCIGQPSEEDQALSPGRSRVFACRCARGFTSLPQGSLAPARVLLSRALIAYSDPIRQSREHAAASRLGRLYAAPSLCGSASATRGTFPTFTAVLSRRAVDHTPVGPRCCPVARAHPGTRLPRFVPESPPTRARLCQQCPAGNSSRRGIVRFMLRPVCLPRPPDWLRPDGVTCAPPGVLRSSVIPALHADRCRTALGIRLNGRTGNLPLSGLAPDQSRQLVRLHDKVLLQSIKAGPNRKCRLIEM